jgi:hypothetical protein
MLVLAKWCFRSPLFEFLVCIRTLSFAQITNLELWDDLVVGRHMEESNRGNISEFSCTIPASYQAIISTNCASSYVCLPWTLRSQNNSPALRIVFCYSIWRFPRSSCENTTRSADPASWAHCLKDLHGDRKILPTRWRMTSQTVACTAKCLRLQSSHRILKASKPSYWRLSYITIAHHTCSQMPSIAVEHIANEGLVPC